MRKNIGSTTNKVGNKRGQPLPSAPKNAAPKVFKKACPNHKASSRQQRATAKGQVAVVGDFPRTLFNSSSDMKHSGVVLKTKRDRLLVYLGPAWFFWKHDFPIKVGDILEVSGPRITPAGHDEIIIAQVVRNQGKTLKIPKKF